MASREAFEVSALAWGSVSPTGQTSPDIAHKRYLRRVNPGRRGYWNGRTAPVSRRVASGLAPVTALRSMAA